MELLYVTHYYKLPTASLSELLGDVSRPIADGSDSVVRVDCQAKMHTLNQTISGLTLLTKDEYAEYFIPAGLTDAQKSLIRNKLLSKLPEVVV